MALLVRESIKFTVKKHKRARKRWKYNEKIQEDSVMFRRMSNWEAEGWKKWCEVQNNLEEQERDVKRADKEHRRVRKRWKYKEKI